MSNCYMIARSPEIPVSFSSTTSMAAMTMPAAMRIDLEDPRPVVWEYENVVARFLGHGIVKWTLTGGIEDLIHAIRP